MSPRHGIVISPGTAIDFSNLVAPQKSTSSLVSRATGKRTNVGGIVVLIILILTAISLIFCAVVVIIILKNKRQRRNRQRKFEESQPMVAHEYRTLDDMEPSTTRGPQELPSEAQLHEASSIHRAEIDGFQAAPKMNNQPIELPPDAHTPGPNK